MLNQTLVLLPLLTQQRLLAAIGKVSQQCLSLVLEGRRANAYAGKDSHTLAV